MQIKAIHAQLPLWMGSVNCYLVETDGGFWLVDSGSKNYRAELVRQLEDGGVRPGNLSLILITHGDFDHIGNASYLRKRYGAKIAMHADDLGMAQAGDMFWNRAKGNYLLGKLVPILIGFSQKDRFTPDLMLDEGDNLSEFGVEAQLFSLPGHSKGSLGILLADGDLFCGDLLDNTRDRPAMNSIMDDPVQGRASVEKLLKSEARMVYPGHGAPFSPDQLRESLA